MRGWLRRIRGAIGVGLTWAVGWGVFGGMLWLLRGAWEIAFSAGLTYAATGFVGGTLFAGILRALEGQRRFDELRISTVPRYARLDVAFRREQTFNPAHFRPPSEPFELDEHKAALFHFDGDTTGASARTTLRDGSSQFPR